jgi:hypothetical protein
MGFYIRKAISVGPFRFNLSKSGIGVSAGIKGLRPGPLGRRHDRRPVLLGQWPPLKILTDTLTSSPA